MRASRDVCCGVDGELRARPNRNVQGLPGSERVS